MSLPHINSTQVPNIIFDYWMNQLTPAQFKVLLCICRKTYGWHKIRDSISLSQIRKMTGMSRQGVVNALTKLQDLELVKKDMNRDELGNNETNYYEIHLQLSVGGSQLSVPPLVNSVYQGVVNSVDTQKKDLTKERHTKRRERAKPLSCTPPLFSFGKHIKMKQDEYDKFVAEYGTNVISEYLQSMDDYIASIRGKPYMDSAAALRNWMRRDKKNGKENVVEEKNEDFALKIADDFNQVRGPQRKVKLEALHGRLEIFSTHPNSTIPATVIKYSENGFKDQVDNALEKWGLK